MKRARQRVLQWPRLAWLGMAAMAAAGASGAAAQPVPGQAPMPRLQISHTLAQPPAPSGASENPAAHPTHWSAGAEGWQPGSHACTESATPPWDHLTLGLALARTLCKSPTLRQALANVAEQTAGLELEEIAGLPRWNASAEYSGARNFNSSGSYGRTAAASVGLSWVLFDFGQRNAQLQAARQTLSAALSNQSNTVLESVRDMLRLYGEAVVAHAGLEASTEAENTASRTADAAVARYQAQVGNQIERLQAQTALAQATLERFRALSRWETARGNLALALGADITQALRLVDWEAWVHSAGDSSAFAELQREAREQHPRTRAAMAQIQSLQARLSAAQAENKGSVSVSASAGSSRNWGAAGSGTTPTASAAIVASIPLFNGRESKAVENQIVAQIQSREAELEAVQRELDSQLWQAYQAARTSRQALTASERLMDSADSAYQVAQGRYRAGVGSMLELLNAQAALADARRERVTAQVERLTAQTQLSLATGRVGPTQTSGPAALR